uniref:Glutaredoxin domain-containing protein n=1 Tax=Timema douglasi TaxID=61478 RepID=A0A7R8VEM5_TIMDO|nr:unnamed protein product [Timema douglasi]
MVMSILLLPPRVYRDYFCSLHVCTGTTSAPSTCVPGLLLPPRVYRGYFCSLHVYTGATSAPSTCVPGLLILPPRVYRGYFCSLHVCTGATSAPSTCVPGLLLLPPRVYRGYFFSLHVCTGATSSPSTCVPGLLLLPPRVYRGYFFSLHVCTGATSSPSTCVPGLLLLPPRVYRGYFYLHVCTGANPQSSVHSSYDYCGPEEHGYKTALGYKEKEVGKVVLYSTTMGVVRKTYQDCVKVKKILRNMMVKYEERDVFMSREVQSEVRDRMNSDVILVPQMFVEGQHIGSCVQTSEPSLEQNLNIPAGHILLFKVMHISG